MIKVLHRASRIAYGGGEINVMNYYRHMDHAKYQFDFITRNQSLSEYPEVKASGMGVKLFTASEQENRELLIQEINAILDEGYDVVHMNTGIWAGFLIEELAMKRKIPKVIVHAHTAGISVDNENARDLLKRHEYYKNLFNTNYATHFLACGRAAAEFLFGSQIPRKRIQIIHNAIEVERFAYHVKRREAVRVKLGLEKQFVIGLIGRMEEQKNQLFFLEIFQSLYHYNPSAKLLLVGEGKQYEEKVRQAVREKGLSHGVEFMGWRSDIHDLMQAMDILAMPSIVEGLPIVAIEAQTAGLPVLLSDQVTEEAVITENARRIPLDEELWVKEIKKYMNGNGFQRRDMSAEITNAGYNIKFAVRELERIYEG